MARITASSLYGTLDLLILKTLSIGGSKHGLEIADEIYSRSGEELQVEEGALYPALHRLQRAGLIAGEWRISEKRRRAKFYDLTPSGHRELERVQQEWTRHTQAVGRVLQVAWVEMR